MNVQKKQRKASDTKAKLDWIAAKKEEERERERKREGVTHTIENLN